MKKLLCAVLALFMGMAAVAGFADDARAEKVLRIAVPKEAANLNPVLIQDVWGESIALSIFDTLVSAMDSSKKVEPLLAEKWTISEDGKVYTFHLRKGVKFHNGDELKASDVKFTFESFLDEKNASPNLQFFKPVTKIETPDDYTVRLTLDAPYAPFLLALANPASGIVPEKVVREMGMDKFDRAPVGTGPYRFSEWVPDDRIVLTKNADYFLKEPNLDKVVIRPIPKPEVMAAELLSGGVDLGSDLLPQDIGRLKDNGLNIYSMPGLSFHYVGFNNEIAPFSDVRFRKAVYHAVPFEKAVPGIYRDSAERAYNWIPQGVLGDDVEYMKSRVLPFDPAKAKALFDELKADGVVKDGMELTIYSTQDPQRSKIATVISTQLRQFGINMKVESPEWGTMFPMLKSGKCGMFMMGWGSVPDPDRWTYRLFTPGSSMNFSRYENSVVAEALEQGRVLTDPAAREKAYTTAMRQALGEDYIHIPLIFKKTINVASDRVVGFAPTPQKYIVLVSGARNVDVK